jgi:Pyruvate/2-oxoacid:ferredoxin oxidoreductase gamma subunit
MPQPITRTNDFVIKFANVNGSGSASANALFAKSILRMGVPISPRNIFPSNIQGLPTWYEVRVTENWNPGVRQWSLFAQRPTIATPRIVASPDVTSGSGWAADRDPDYTKT